jgi:hypothetical protein
MKLIHFVPTALVLLTAPLALAAPRHFTRVAPRSASDSTPQNQVCWQEQGNCFGEGNCEFDTVCGPADASGAANDGPAQVCHYEQGNCFGEGNCEQDLVCEPAGASDQGGDDGPSQVCHDEQGNCFGEDNCETIQVCRPAS